jgi:Superfamily II DNA/RNA helicases, SNF2 family
MPLCLVSDGVATLVVAWMLEKEASSLKGGCLGDDIGLGKVSATLAISSLGGITDPVVH